MNFQFHPEDLKPVVEAVVVETIRALSESPISVDERLGYTEPEAAQLLGISAYALRDARVRGDITPTKVGGRIGYERSELISYLKRGRQRTSPYPKDPPAQSGPGRADGRERKQ